MGIVMPYEYEIPIPVLYPTKKQVYQAMEDFLRMHLFNGVFFFEDYELDEERGVHWEDTGALPKYVSGWTKQYGSLEPQQVAVHWLDTRRAESGEGSIIIVQLEQQ